MKTSELRSKSADELQNELIALLREQFNLRVQKGIGQIPQAHLFRKVRKQVARIKTILREKEGS
jgi:large subunit ribosomal protein L29